MFCKSIFSITLEKPVKYPIGKTLRPILIGVKIVRIFA